MPHTQPSTRDTALKNLDVSLKLLDTYGGPDRWSEQYLGKGLKGNRIQAC